MSYYRPSFSQTVAMSRGRGFSSSRGGSSYRGGGSRGNSSWNSRGSYNTSTPNNSRFSSSFSNSFDSRSKYGGSSDRYSGSRNHPDNYRKSYRQDSGSYSGRDAHRSPERKRMRTDTLSSRHDSSYGGDGYNRYDSSSYQERRSFSDDRRPPPISRREEFRKPPPPSTSRGGYRGRLTVRGSLRSRLRDPPLKRSRLVASYTMRRRMTKLRSAAIRRYRREQELAREKEKEKDVAKEEKKEEKEDETEEDKEKVESEEKSPKKTPKKEKSEEPTSDKEDKKEDSDDEDRPRRKFIKLHCPHCATKCGTFRKYSIHLKSGRHMAVMRRVAMKQKAILQQMRMAQRKAQKELEKTTDDLAPRTNFCPLCKLNYKQPKPTHRATEAHKNMKKFLMPYCKICKITLKSPMLYEDHLCSIEHIKCKSLLINGDKSDDGSGDDNLENFMTIDSVGDVEDEETTSDVKKKETPEKPAINVGIESIRKVEVHYCDLCLMYLPRVDDEEVPKVLAKHCKQRTHMTRYIRYKEDKEIAKRAERLQRKETAEKEKEKDKDKEDGEEGDADKKDSKAEDDDQGDDKLWADVDKDLGDILAEAESGNKSSDEDDNERYDRFKLSEGKNGEEKKLVDDKEETADKAVENGTEADKK